MEFKREKNDLLHDDIKFGIEIPTLSHKRESNLDGIIFLGQQPTLLLLELYVPQCAGKENIWSWILNLSGDQFYQTLNWSTCDLCVFFLKIVQVPITIKSQSLKPIAENII